MEASSRDVSLLRALDRGQCPRGSERDLERLEALLGVPCVNREHPRGERPYLFLERHTSMTDDPGAVVRRWLTDHGYAPSGSSGDEHA